MLFTDTRHGIGSDTRHPKECTCRNLRSVLHDYLMVAIVSYHLAELYVHAHALKEVVSFLG